MTSQLNTPDLLCYVININIFVHQDKVVQRDYDGYNSNSGRVRYPNYFCHYPLVQQEFMFMNYNTDTNCTISSGF